MMIIPKVCGCGGVLDFVYHIWYQCRECERWVRRRV